MNIYDPKISVVMATYNGDNFLGKQVESIISQTRPPHELIVIDDDSTADPRDLLATKLQGTLIKFRYLRNTKNRGSNFSFRLGVRISSGDLIFFSDQDDIWYTEKIEEHVLFHQRNPSAMVVYNDCHYFVQNKVINSPSKADVIESYHGTLEYFVAGCCTSFKKPVADAVNFNLFSFQNYDDQVHTIGKLFNSRLFLNSALQIYRRHGNNQSNLPQNMPKLNRNIWIKYRNKLTNFAIKSLYLHLFILDQNTLETSKNNFNVAGQYLGIESSHFGSVIECIYLLKECSGLVDQLLIFYKNYNCPKLIGIIGGFLCWRIRGLK